VACAAHQLRLLLGLGVVAERQGQIAALNTLGQWQRFGAMPFFWSRHRNLPWDGDIAARDCLLRYERDNHPPAMALIHRDMESLKAEPAMEGAR
jgi:hypothetical protein